MQANKNPIKINNNYFDKFDYSKELNSNNQYFSTGLYNRPYLKIPGIEWVNDVKAGDISAFKKYLTIRRAYSYYDDLLLLPLLHKDVRVKLIHHILDEGELLDVIDALEVLTHNYNLDKFKDELKPKFLKRLADANRLPLSYDERKKIEQWNGIVSSVFPGSDELIVPIPVVPTPDDLLSASRDGDTDAFNQFLEKYRHCDSDYDNLTNSIQDDVREELIFVTANKDNINLDVLDVLTLDYDITKIKDNLYTRLNKYSLTMKQRKPNEQWNELVIRLFGNSSDELITSYDKWKQDVAEITDPYPKEDLRLSARSYLDEFIEITQFLENRKVVSDKFIGAYEYDNTKVWLYECYLLESEDDTTSITTNCYVISLERPDPPPLTLYTNLKKGEIDYKKIVIDSIKFSFTTLV